MANYVENADGSRTWFVEQDRLEAAALLDGDGAPELDESQFTQLKTELAAIEPDPGDVDSSA